jgi:hypothetical protein
MEVEVVQVVSCRVTSSLYLLELPIPSLLVVEEQVRLQAQVHIQMVHRVRLLHFLQSLPLAVVMAEVRQQTAVQEVLAEAEDLVLLQRQGDLEILLVQRPRKEIAVAPEAQVREPAVGAAQD